MEPIYDPYGKTVGWLTNDVAYDIYGQPRAFLAGNDIVSYTGMHLGILDSGFFRDHYGNAVAFISSASGGPLPPIPEVPPAPPVPLLAPVPPIPPVPPVPALPSLSWSHLTWEEFLES